MGLGLDSRRHLEPAPEGSGGVRSWDQPLPLSGALCSGLTAVISSPLNRSQQYSYLLSWRRQAENSHPGLRVDQKAWGSHLHEELLPTSEYKERKGESWEKFYFNCGAKRQDSGQSQEWPGPFSCSPLYSLHRWLDMGPRKGPWEAHGELLSPLIDRPRITVSVSFPLLRPWAASALTQSPSVPGAVGHRVTISRTGSSSTLVVGMMSTGSSSSKEWPPNSSSMKTIREPCGSLTILWLQVWQLHLPDHHCATPWGWGWLLPPVLQKQPECFHSAPGWRKWDQNTRCAQPRSSPMHPYSAAKSTCSFTSMSWNWGLRTSSG